MGRLPQTNTTVSRYLRQQKRVVTRMANATPYALSGTSVTAPGLMKVDERLVAGDPAGSRVELDEAGLRKYAADGTTVQVDLTGEVAAFSGLITGSEIIGGVFKTEATGNRIEITSTEVYGGGNLLLYTGHPDESAPGSIWAEGLTGVEYGVGSLWIHCPRLGSADAYLHFDINKHDTDSALDYSEATLEATHVVIGPGARFGDIHLHAGALLRDYDMTETFVGSFDRQRWGALRFFIVDSSLSVTDAGSLAALLWSVIAPTVAAPLVVWDIAATPGAQLKYTTNGTTWTVIGGGGGGSPASETVAGIVELATSAEAVTGTDTVRAVTPAGVKAAIDPWATSSSHLLFTPTGNLDTPASGTATWMTLGNVTVPAWATKADVVYAINGIYQITAAANVTVVMKIGTVAGVVSKRILTLPTDPSTPRSNLPIMDTFTGLTAGVKSVTLSATWVIAAGAYRADVNSYVTALFTWRP